MAPHSNTFAWKTPWTEEPGRLQSMGSLESDTTERLHFHFSLSCIGAGNGNPLQCSCLENPRDGEAWWAAVYGVAQSRAWLKWLSSSSSSSSTRASSYFSFLTRKMKVSLHACIPSHFSHIRLFATLWTIAHQTPLSMGFSRREYWSRFPYPPPGDLPDPGIEPMSLCLQHWQLGSSPLAAGKASSVFTVAPHHSHYCPSSPVRSAAA